VNFAFRIVAILTAAMVASSCSWFGDKDEEELEPTELTDIVTSVDIRRLWNVKVGDDAEFLRVALQPAGDGNRIYAASRDGNVVALDPETGREFWRVRLDIELSAGPGVGEGLVVVGAADGYLIGLDAVTGAEKWRSYIVGETLAKPLIKNNLVVAITIDNRLRAVSAFDGAERWIVEQATPRLTVRGSATPVAVGSSVIAGFDNGRLAAVNLDTGDILWEAMLSPPSGRSDLERLADVDGMISVVGQDVYAAGYQGSVAAVASESGQLLWLRDVSSHEGVSADWNNLYTVTEEGSVVALTRRTGDETWRQNSLIRREPTLPIAFNTTVAVGDFEGYLHFFSNFDGEAVARVRIGNEAISNEPVVVSNRLYVQSDSGSVAAYAVRESNRSRNAPETSDEGA
jgi:outer membrane protein assembly factor BamB